MTRSLGIPTLLIGVLILTALSPITIAASHGGMVLDIGNMTTEGDGDVGPGSIWVNLTVAERVGGDADGILNISISSLEGTLVDAIELVLNLSTGESSAISHEFAALDVGAYSLTLGLSGDLGVDETADGTTWASSNTSTVWRARPLSIGLAQTGQWTISSIANDGQSTGEPPRDGDQVNLTIPVVNLGDVSGQVDLSLDLYRDLGSSGSVLNTSFGPLAVNSTADGTISTETDLGDLAEGDWIVTATIDPDDDDSTDDSRSLSFVVGAPPLARLTMTMSNTSADEAGIGDEVLFDIDLLNDGEVDWVGRVVCGHPDDRTEVHNTSLTVLVGQTGQTSFTVNASPGLLTCAAVDGGRIATDSASSDSHLFSMPSAELGVAGGGDIVLSGGPWHQGDQVGVSILAHNSGQHPGGATLWLSEEGMATQGISIQVPEGGTVELTLSHTLDGVGNRAMEWWVSSPDGLVDQALQGGFDIEVASSQSVTPLISDVDWSVSGMAVAYSVELSPGKDRVVTVEAGVRVDGIDTTLSTFQWGLSPGLHHRSVDLGAADSQGEVFVRLVAVGWSSTGSTEDAASIPQERPNPVVSISPASTPIRPLAGDSVTITCTIQNSGGATSAPAEVRLLDPHGVIKASSAVDALESGASQEVTMLLSPWPEGSVVDLECQLLHSTGQDSDSASFLSGEVIDDQASGLDALPMLDIGVGIGIAIGVVLVARLAHGWRQAGDEIAESSGRKRKPGLKSDEKTVSVVGDEPADAKQEVSCSACDQRLSVPQSFAGTVRCPACRHEFEVEAKAMETRAKPSPVLKQESREKPAPKRLVDQTGEVAKPEDEDEPEEEGELKGEEDDDVVRSSTDILQCPTCEAKLRVPLEKRPARARCPSCKSEFMAEVA